MPFRKENDDSPRLNTFGMTAALPSCIPQGPVEYLEGKAEVPLTLNSINFRVGSLSFGEVIDG